MGPVIPRAGPAAAPALRPGPSVRPPCTGPGWTTVLRGALRKPNRTPRSLPAISPSDGVAATDPGDELESPAHGRPVDARVESGQAQLVDLPRRVEETRLLAVEDDAHVDELLTVDARHGTQHDVLVRVVVGSVELTTRLPAATAGARRRRRGGPAGRRRTTRAARPGSPYRAPASSQPSGTSATTSVSTVVGERGRELGVERRDLADRPREHVLGCVVRLRREAFGGARLPRSSRGGSRARHRGRSARAVRARPAGWGCASCGRRWRRRRRARAAVRRSPRVTSTEVSKPNEPGRKSTPRLLPRLAVSRSCTSSSAS